MIPVLFMLSSDKLMYLFLSVWHCDPSLFSPFLLACLALLRQSGSLAQRVLQSLGLCHSDRKLIEQTVPLEPSWCFHVCFHGLTEAYCLNGHKWNITYQSVLKQKHIHLPLMRRNVRGNKWCLKGLKSWISWQRSAQEPAEESHSFFFWKPISISWGWLL